MKKIFLCIATMMMLFATSCQRVENPNAIGVESEVTFSIQTPELMTRADYGDGTSATDLTVAVYNGEAFLFKKEATMENKQANVKLSLVNGMTYNIVFWAQNENAPYEFTPESHTMVVDYSAVAANNENLDAFWKKIEYKSEGAKTQPVELTRPFAQLNVLASDWNDANDNSKIKVEATTMKVKNVYNTMNMLTGTVENEEEVTFTENRTPHAEKQEHSSYKTAEGWAWLAMNYILIDEQRLVEVEMTVPNPEVNDKIYRSIPVQRNYRTNIYGRILTSDTDFNVEIKEGFDGDEDIQHIATGIYLNENGDYVITEAAGLRFVANMANEGVGTKATDSFKSMFEGKTIILSSDIDLAGEEWTPMDLWGCTSLTIDGAGHIISNMVIKGQGSLGFISKCTGNINIKDLTFENPIVEGTASFIGVVIGYQYGVATLNNVDVHGGVVSTNIANIGIRIGGLIGFSAPDSGGFDLKDCDVSETEIRGYHNVGGLVGTALAKDKSFMSDCSVTNCKFYFSGKYEEPDENGNCGYHVYDSQAYEEGYSVKENCTESGNQAFYVKISSEDAVYGESDKVVYVNNPENLQKVLLNKHTHTIMLGAGEFVADIYNGTTVRESLTIIGSEGTKFGHTATTGGQLRLDLFKNFTIKNCEIIQRSGYKTWGHIVFGSGNKADGVYTIENCTFNGVGTQGIYINETVSGATYNILNCTFNGDFGSEGAITIQTNKDVNHTINIKGCEFNDIPEDSHKIFLAKNGEGSYYYGWTLNTDLKASSSAEIVDFINMGVESINLGTDVTYSNKIENDLSLYLNDHTFEATGTIELSNNANLTMIGGDYVVNGTYGHVDVRPSTAEGSVVVYENIDFSYNKLGPTYGPSTDRLGSVVEVCATVSEAKTKIKFKNCTFTNAMVLFEGMSGKTGTFDATFENCKFDALTSSAPIYVQNYIKGSITVRGCTFNLECTSSTASAISVSPSSSTEITVIAENNTIEAIAATPYTHDESKGETNVHDVKVNGTPNNIKFISAYSNTKITESNTTKTGIAI